MKATENDLRTVYRKLKNRIDLELPGVEVARLESEVTYKNITYWIDYEVIQKFDDIHYGYDTPPEDRTQTSISILKSAVFDPETGERIPSDFDPVEIEQMFDFIHAE